MVAFVPDAVFDVLPLAVADQGQCEPLAFVDGGLKVCALLCRQSKEIQRWRKIVRCVKAMLGTGIIAAACQPDEPCVDGWMRESSVKRYGRPRKVAFKTVEEDCLNDFHWEPFQRREFSSHL